MIKLNKLNKFFFKNKKNEIHVLNDVNLELDSKGFVAIHGPSGSGKTTLLNVIGGLDKVNSGEIDFFGQKLSGYKAGVWDKIRNEHVGYIFQNYYLLPHLSVLDNIKFVLKLIGIKDEEYIESRVNYVLKAVGMYPFRKKKALQLSGGQQQRVAIARALVKNPKVIIADEPTGNLDSKNTIEIMNIIKEISKEKLVILVTHEKNLAEMYASRIINISDGKIVDDVINEESENHEVDDDAIYLKDIKNQEVIEKDNYKFNLYSDEEVKDLDIRLIVKNETLYLDVKGDFKNVKLADKSSGVTIKDAHYKKKTKEEVTKTTFDMLEIDHSKVEKDRKMLVSFKQTFMMAFEKLLTIGRKGKLMLFSFFIAGIILAFSTATFASVAVVRAEASMTLPKGYVIVEDNNKKFQEFKETLGGTDEKFYVNPFYNVDLKFINHNGDVIASQYGRFDINDHAKLYKLTKGKYAENNNEIVITSGLIEEFFSRGGAEDVGIWNINQLMKEKIRYADNYAQIVGVVDSESKIIFASEMFAMANVFDGQTPYEAYDNLEILYGSSPNQDEVLVSDNLMKYMFGEDYNKDNFPETYTKPNGQLLKISGVHAHPDALEIYGFDELMRIFPLNNNVIGIYSSNSGKVIEGLKTHFNLKGEDYYQTTHDLIKRQRRVQLASSLVTTAFLVGFSLVGFYFVIRSSLIERLYEVAVFRALGVSKKEVLSSFLVEIFTITTITSFIGYSITSYGLRKAQGGILGMFNVFYVNGLTYILGLILVYGLNLIAGLLPILILLRKTPAQILSDHDI